MSKSLLEAWLASGLGKREYWRVYRDELQCTYDAFHGRLWREQKRLGLPPDPGRLTARVGLPLHLTGDAMIVADVHVPSTDYDLAMLPAMIAQRALKRPRTLIIAGDLFNMDAFSAYEPDLPEAGLVREIAAAKWLLSAWLQAFDHIYYMPGNHERRISKRTHGQVLISHLMQMVTQDERVTVTQWGHIILSTPAGEWRITHARNYSTNQLTVAAKLADLYHQHVIQAHEHHAAIGHSKSGRYIVCNPGILGEPEAMAYASLDDAASTKMQKGFVMLRNGVPYLFGPSLTDWDLWLGTDERPSTRKSKRK